MPTATTAGSTRTTEKAPSNNRRGTVSPITNGRGRFVVPLVHVALPESAVTMGFWGALIGATALGVVELPLAALIGAGVAVARHRNSH